jgi:hypothetical protein
MITNLRIVKTLARLFDIVGEGLPTVSGETGEIYLDTETGLSYIFETTWQPYTKDDYQINLMIGSVEQDYLQIRGIPFDIEDEEPVYPIGADVTAGEMVCYRLGIGDYEGIGKTSESLGGRSVAFDHKLMGYPVSIVGRIVRYVGIK